MTRPGQDEASADGDLPSDERLEIASELDVLQVRKQTRALSLELGFGVVEQTKLVTAASELARNTLVHGLGGHAMIRRVERNGRPGIEIVFEDRGPGIADVERALSDGYSTGGGMGLGLGGARRLVNEFQIESSVGSGTRVTIVRWKQ